MKSKKKIRLNCRKALKKAKKSILKHSENMRNVPQKMYSTKRVIRNIQQKKYRRVSTSFLTENLQVT